MTESVAIKFVKIFLRRKDRRSLIFVIYVPNSVCVIIRVITRMCFFTCFSDPAKSFFWVENKGLKLSFYYTKSRRALSLIYDIFDPWTCAWVLADLFILITIDAAFLTLFILKIKYKKNFLIKFLIVLLLK